MRKISDLIFALRRPLPGAFLIQKIMKGERVMGGIIAALITSGVGLIGIIITNVTSNHKVENTLKTSQAVTDCKIDELTREVREHNNFAKRMPVVEEQIKEINHRIEDLERKE